MVGQARADEAISLGLDAGVGGGTLHARIDERLQRWAQTAQAQTNETAAELDGSPADLARRR